MSSREENVERVRRGLEAFNQGDAEAVLSLLDEEVEIYSAPELANPGTYVGHEGYIQWLGRWLDAWDGFTVEPQRVEAVGERHVVADVQQHARGRGSGIPVEMRIGYMFELGESTMKALYLYPSWDEAVALAREREGAD